MDPGLWIAVLGVDYGVRCGICATIKGLKMVPGLRRDDAGVGCGLRC